MNEKGIAVAQDVLKELGLLRLRTKAAYLSGNIPPGLVVAESDLQDNLEVVQQHCTVCFVGACLLSKARLYDAVPMSRLFPFNNVSQVYITGEDVKKLLVDIFSPQESDCIEAAFEVYPYLADSATPREDLVSASEFGRQWASAHERAEHIALNIIENEGHFVPTQYSGNPKKEEASV